MVNYDLIFEEGELYPGQPVFRAKPMDGSKFLTSNPGYGLTQYEAAKDFIRRNDNNTIDKVFDRKRS